VHVVQIGAGKDAAHKHMGAQLESLGVHEALVQVQQENQAEIQRQRGPLGTRVKEWELQTRGCGLEALRPM
jgi:hypothetical protein